MRADIDDEDSLAPRLQQKEAHRALDLAVIRLPHISNFTDFSPLEEHPAMGVRYVDCLERLGTPDLVIIPGTKSTVSDLMWLRQNGLEAAILKLSGNGVPVLGVCGGYQILGEKLSDPYGVECRGEYRGLGLLPCHTVFSPQKTRTRKQAAALARPFAGAALDGYEIHMGETDTGGAAPFCRFSDGALDGAVQGDVFGTYLHGLFDTGELTGKLAAYLAARKGISIDTAAAEPRSAYKQRQYDMLAEAVRASLDMDKIYRVMEEYEHGGE